MKSIDNVPVINGRNIRIYIDNDQNRYPSVTSIIGFEEENWIKEWREKEPNWKKILQYAATVGTISHWRFGQELGNLWGYPIEPLELTDDDKDVIDEWYDEFPYHNKKMGVKDAITMNMVVFNEWIKQFNPQPPIYSNQGRTIDMNINPIELAVRSKKFGYAGRVDLICSINSINYIVDFKTNDYVHSKYAVQLSGYKIALEEMYPKYDFTKMAIVNISQSTYKWNFSEQQFYKKGWLTYLQKFYSHDSVKSVIPFNQISKNMLNIKSVVF